MVKHPRTANSKVSIDHVWLDQPKLWDNMRQKTSTDAAKKKQNRTQFIIDASDRYTKLLLT